MQSDGEFNNTKVRAKMAAGLGERVDQGPPNVFSELGKVFQGKLLQVVAVIDFGEIHCRDLGKFKKVLHSPEMLQSHALPRSYPRWHSLFQKVLIRSLRYASF